MILWQSTLTDDLVEGMNPAALEDLIQELDDAVAVIVESYILEYPA